MLLNGKGKHRRASKATRVATLVGVTGAAVAAPLMAAGSASAATASEWDAVAQCESGGNWSINTGNGFQGGLQFTPSTWSAYGGTKYAPTADKASKAQQIEIGEKVLAGQGKGAWPNCGTGLSNASGGGGGSQEQAPQQEQTKPQPQQTQPQQAPQQQAPQEQAAPKPQPTPQTDSKKTVETPTGKTVKKGDGEYKVKTGDTLSKIAEAKHVKGGWHKVYKLNGDIIDNADMIYPGQQLHLS
ncbi:transglycosylase family protein [Streptomyces sp. NPDC002564]|uniref:transglycosylase family protein n=1 Tax=Streptomyces sp. NPDC002564 TaxID=3364649 RepID=UPI00368EF754